MALAGLAGRAGSRVSTAEGEAEADEAMEALGRAVAMGYRNANEMRIEPWAVGTDGEAGRDRQREMSGDRQGIAGGGWILPPGLAGRRLLE